MQHDNQVEIGKVVPTDTTRMGRMLHGGRLTATMKSAKTGEHVTLTLHAMKKDGKWEHAIWADATHVFIKRGHGEYGSDTIGTYYPLTGKLYWKSRDAAWRYAALHTLLAATTGQQSTDKFNITEASMCGKCGRELTDPESIARGIGPTCLGALTGSVHYRQMDENLVERVREVATTPTYVPGTTLTVEQHAAAEEAALGGTTDKRGRPVPRTFEALAAAVKR